MKRMLLFFATLWLGIMGASAQSYKYDLNDYGVVNVTDVIQLVNYILGKENETHVAVDLGLPTGTTAAAATVGVCAPSLEISASLPKTKTHPQAIVVH